mmetsp:Transcript_16460/g.34576  ORF Transcript_16460/g.34576 Transcript_16460/m.34576 type:complete len:341 (+) Transcript_16460:117-1139(+)|eukprot:CAMPEP_0171327618 /NCGR_PEP_ID=MMETSP0878-20121228/136_1 /TAXON_ID=67004 /ORGANISM="Thalassiosira weissflogii, Strain CCMP1336" /LENGTH=340 /DNA_ID=CAMNT_0011827403 /DNA_START=57 /DNA_END=1079 /DNA_ORIENTATION=+
MKLTGALTLSAYTLWLVSEADAFSARSLLHLKSRAIISSSGNNSLCNNNPLHHSHVLQMSNYMGGPPPPPPPMGGGGGGGGGRMGGGDPNGYRRPSPPPQRGDGRSPNLDRHANDYIDDLRSRRGGGGGGGMGGGGGNRGNSMPGGGPDGGGTRSYSANSPPTSFSVPSAGNTAGQPRSRGVGPDARGLAQLASGVSTPMDKYKFEGPGRRERAGGYIGDPMRGPPGGPMGTGPMERRGGPDRGVGGGGRGGYDPRDNYNRERGMAARASIDEMDVRDLQDEVQRLRTENAMLKRTAQDLMNNFNELSNRLFDVDESLKKVANVFPSEEEMESLEWLLKK